MTIRTDRRKKELETRPGEDCPVRGKRKQKKEANSPQPQRPQGTTKHQCRGAEATKMGHACWPAPVVQEPRKLRLEHAENASLARGLRARLKIVTFSKEVISKDLPSLIYSDFHI